MEKLNLEFRKMYKTKTKVDQKVHSKMKALCINKTAMGGNLNLVPRFPRLPPLQGKYK